MIGQSVSDAAQITPESLTVFLADKGYEIEADTAGSGSSDRPFYIVVKLAGRYQHHTNSEAGDQAEEASEEAPKTADQLPWEEVGLFEKVRRIEAILDEHVRDALAADGGGIDLVDLQDNTLTVQYNGACGSCASSVGGTMQFIEDTLEAHIGVPIRLDVQGMDEGGADIFGM